MSRRPDVDDLGASVFAADPCAPTVNVPVVVPVVEPIFGVSAAAASTSTAPLARRRPSEQELLQLQHPPGVPESGTVDWPVTRTLLRCDAATILVSLSVCDVEHLRRSGSEDGASSGFTLVRADSAEPVEVVGWNGWTRSLEPPRLSTPPPDATHRSFGVVTDFKLENFCPGKKEEAVVHSRHLACVDPLPADVYTSRWHGELYLQYLLPAARYLGLQPYLPVSDLQLGCGLEYYLSDRPRTCCDSRFCRPSAPEELRPALPEDDFVFCRWPECSGYSDRVDDYDELWAKQFGERERAFVSVAHDVSTARAQFEEEGGLLVPLKNTVLIVLPEPLRERSELLPDPIEVGLWSDLLQSGFTGGSGLDRRDFGKSCLLLGSPVFLDANLGPGFLMLKRSQYFSPNRGVHYLRDLLQPLVDLPASFDPRSSLFRLDALQLHPRNDSLHWGYPSVSGCGRNPYPIGCDKKFDNFCLSDVVFNASRFDHLYPEEADRRLIRLLFGLDDHASSELYLLTPMDLYRIQMLSQIRPYTLVDGESCSYGRERLAAIDVGHWTVHAIDVDSHGLGCVEFAGVALSVIAAEVALSPTVLTPDGQPAFFFDHRARGHDGLVMSGGSGGQKKCFQFLMGLLEGVRSPAASSLRGSCAMYHGRRAPVAEDCRQPCEEFYYDAVSGIRHPRPACYEALRPGCQPVSPYQDRFHRRNGDVFEPITWIGLPGVRCYKLPGTVNTSRTMLSLPSLIPIAPFEAVCAAFYDAVVDITKSRKPSDVGRTSCRFSPAHYGPSRAFNRGTGSAVRRDGAQTFRDYMVDTNGEPVGLGVEEIEARLGFAPFPVADVDAEAEVDSDVSVPSPASKRARVAEEVDS
ncbi:unnamed protein product [Oikopleura dioica]|uniref:Uncharacterized protein n=1 Tax=Oikopleura dioica TaxID=34765 RepID=E4Y483_OIKDI|nr:unnamed protein product [Oikopleura dioica]